MQSAGTAGGRTRTVRVLVVDDHDLFRSGLGSLLGDQSDLDLVGEASDGQTAIRLAAEVEPDVVLLDLGLPDLPGHQVISGILAQQPEASVVALVPLAEEESLARAAGAGACGFLPKESPIAEVLGAVRAAAQAGAWLSPTAADDLLEHPLIALTRHQQEVLRLVARGIDSRKINAQLKTRPGTTDEVAEIVARLPLARRIIAAA